MKITCIICGEIRDQRQRKPFTCSPNCGWEKRRRDKEIKYSAKVGEPFKDWLEREYAKGKTLLELGRLAGVDSTNLLRVWFPRYGIITRPPHHGIGKNGITQKGSIAFNANLVRMNTANPIHRIEAAEKRAQTISKTYRNMPTEHEAATCDLLDKSGIEYIFQYPVGKYVPDFFFASKMLLIEIDRWRPQRRKAKWIIRDNALRQLGFRLVRLQYRYRPELTARAVIQMLCQYKVIG